MEGRIELDVVVDVGQQVERVCATLVPVMGLDCLQREGFVFLQKYRIFFRRMFLPVFFRDKCGSFSFVPTAAGKPFCPLRQPCHGKADNMV